MKAIHFNTALNPDRTALPVCSIRSVAQRIEESRWRVTTDPRRVTCRRCRQMLEKSKTRQRRPTL